MYVCIYYVLRNLILIPLRANLSLSLSLSLLPFYFINLLPTSLLYISILLMYIHIDYVLRNIILIPRGAQVDDVDDEIVGLAGVRVPIHVSSYDMKVRYFPHLRLLRKHSVCVSV